MFVPSEYPNLEVKVKGDVREQQFKGNGQAGACIANTQVSVQRAHTYKNVQAIQKVGSKLKDFHSLGGNPFFKIIELSTNVSFFPAEMH